VEQAGSADGPDVGFWHGAAVKEIFWHSERCRTSQPNSTSRRCALPSAAA